MKHEIVNDVCVSNDAVVEKAKIANTNCMIRIIPRGSFNTRVLNRAGSIFNTSLYRKPKTKTIIKVYTPRNEDEEEEGEEEEEKTINL